MSKQAKSRDNLETMRLPELQARYQEVIGEATHTPNKSFLIRRIREALAAKPADEVASKPAPAQKALGKRQAKKAKEQAPAATQGLLAPLLGVLKRGAAPSGGQREPAPRAASPKPRSVEAQSPAQPATESATPSKPPRGRFSSMTIEELQTMYREVVGRSTGSDNRSYVEPVNMGSPMRAAA